MGGLRTMLALGPNIGASLLPHSGFCHDRAETHTWAATDETSREMSSPARQTRVTPRQRTAQQQCSSARSTDEMSSPDADAPITTTRLPAHRVGLR